MTITEITRREFVGKGFMDEHQVIQKFFRNETSAMSYIRSRLLGKFEEAPPATSDRFIEEFSTDLLRHLVDHLEDKTIFWNACFRLFKEWRDPKKANKDRATSLRELIYMIHRFDHDHKEIFSREKERWLEELDAWDLGETPYPEKEKNLVYVQNVSLVHAWDLWPDERWERLYKNIVGSRDVNNEAQFELMLIVTQRLKWDAAKTMLLFQWTLNQSNLPETFYSRYFFHRLCLCGNSITKTAIEEQTRCQNELVDDILKTQGKFFYHAKNLPKGKKVKLGKALLEASELFDLKSFKCLGERRRSLLNREIAKLIQPPSEDETNILKPTTSASSGDGYMTSNYAGGYLGLAA